MMHLGYGVMCIRSPNETTLVSVSFLRNGFVEKCPDITRMSPKLKDGRFSVTGSSGMEVASIPQRACHLQLTKLEVLFWADRRELASIFDGFVLPELRHFSVRPSIRLHLWPQPQSISLLGSTIMCPRKKNPHERGR